MSKLCDQVIGVVKSVFPELNIKTEEFVLYKNQKLYLDIFIPQLGIVIEVHGRQHDEFVEHFHSDERGFRLSRYRDRLKEEWVDQSGYTMVILRERDLPITSDVLLERIDEASN